MRGRSGHDGDDSGAPRRLSEVRAEREGRQRFLRESRLGACLLYPLRDGPGVGLLVFFAPVLWVLSLPVFDVVAALKPLSKGDWALGLLVLPILLPLAFSFAMTFGYVLLSLGQMLVTSAMGEDDHPRWPEWHPNEITAGLGRWAWSAASGLAVGGFPAVVYWVHCGPIDGFDGVVLAELAVLGAGYAQMALAASLLHDHILASNPITVLRSIVRVGWDFVKPMLVGGVALLLGSVAFVALFRLPTVRDAIVGLLAFWVFALYEAMVVLRLLGLTYHAHAPKLLWFYGRPKWGTPSRIGRIYSNS